ncbi:MAG: hypothetical protein AUJ57_07045 [Zetaproteobacteria bacterium CG1_02_53_45]|nr:MAG: hypothetical protein AUJ57_07045 [Zetaproteobacteria bacterium CG1_02_53_45]
MSVPVLSPSGCFKGKGIRFGAITLSLFLHGLLFTGFGGAPATALQQPVESVTRLSFLTPSPQPVSTPEVMPEPEPETVEVKPEPKPEPKRELKKLARKKAVDPIRKVVKKQLSQPVAAPTVQAENMPQISEGMIKRETERYLTEVMAHIEKHKWYPKAARRRGIEGEVYISFTLLPDGSAYQLVVQDGPSVLMAAARKAVEKAAPMPQPPASINCPLECEFRMSFNLKTS